MREIRRYMARGERQETKCDIFRRMDILVGNVEQLSDLFRCLAFDHVGDSLASDVTVGQLHCTSTVHRMLTAKA
jgi:hypothetical protein